ncbi:MAG: TadE/TadG family type IV pilus assembly protein [Gammaproteobacteria bacterium]|nr:TadE/TadG family type IV pilus assembly protein [Gammaproteobacteria bacterium]
MIGDHHSAGRTKGVVLLETIIVLPLLLVLMLVTAEFGQAFWQYSALTKSLRDGARFASSAGLLGSTGVVVITGEFQTNVRNVVVYGNTAGTGTPVLPGFVTSAVSVDAPGDGDVIVRASYPYQALFGLVPTFYGASASAPLTLDAAVRMKAL